MNYHSNIPVLSVYCYRGGNGKRTYPVVLSSGECKSLRSTSCDTHLVGHARTGEDRSSVESSRVSLIGETTLISLGRSV